MLKLPQMILFDFALRKAGLRADQIWYYGNSVKTDGYGAHGAGIFPVLCEERNTPRGLWFDNTGLEISFPHLHIRSWTEMIPLLQSANPDTSEIQF